ncbi:MAG: ketoacyl-ACP synthase III [Gammaproteobacteria bacterium]
MNQRASITGWGKCLPPARLTNHDLATVLDTSDEWIRNRTGIGSRYVSHVATTELARVAAQRALAAAGRDPMDIDCLILATCSPDTLVPCAAAELQRKLGCKNAATFDLNSGCTGFVYALANAAGLIASGQQQRILVVAAERLSFYMDWTERDVAALFGDGAGAAIIEADTNEDVGILAWSMGCDGNAADALKVADFGADPNNTRGSAPFDFYFDGREIFRNAVHGMADTSREALAKANLDLDDVDLVIPHQANLRIIEAVARALELTTPPFSNIEHYGNTSAASIPIALCEALEQDRVQAGQLILFTAFGAGLTRASMLVRWGPRTKPLGQSKAELAACECSGLELIAPAVAACRAKRGGHSMHS